MLRNETVPVAKVVTARVTLYITVRDVKKRAMKAPTAATDINILKTAALAVADVRSVVYAVSPVAVMADIIPAFTPSTTYFSRSLFKASVPRSQLSILSRRDHITYGLWGFKVIICVGWQIRIKFSPASAAQDCSSCQIMSRAIASLRMEMEQRINLILNKKEMLPLVQHKECGCHIMVLLPPSRQTVTTGQLLPPRIARSPRSQPT
ncbi:unnamed protein product [Sphagnum balticum]